MATQWNEEVCDRIQDPIQRAAAGCDATEYRAEESALAIINTVLGVVAVVAVVFIIVGGVQYITSSGDTGKAMKAKNTIMYAVIGLVIALLAFAIVNFVLSNIL
ncbi:MAG: hypothetical protein Q4E46_01330 [Candidatus Saccharibacteria bacterium]|nr:hypothetical protein [Candidatus Saccharibacteria bacterium]